MNGLRRFGDDARGRHLAEQYRSEGAAISAFVWTIRPAGGIRTARHLELAEPS
jgi:hypothetical protein